MKYVKLNPEEKLGTDYVIEGSIKDFISHLKDKEKDYKCRGYTDIRVAFENVWDYDDCEIIAVYYGRKK